MYKVEEGELGIWKDDVGQSIMFAFSKQANVTAMDLERRATKQHPEDADNE